MVYGFPFFRNSSIINPIQTAVFLRRARTKMDLKITTLYSVSASDLRGSKSHCSYLLFLTSFTIPYHSRTDLWKLIKSNDCSSMVNFLSIDPCPYFRCSPVCTLFPRLAARGWSYVKSTGSATGGRSRKQGANGGDSKIRARVLKPHCIPLFGYGSDMAPAMLISTGHVGRRWRTGRTWLLRHGMHATPGMKTQQDHLHTRFLNSQTNRTDLEPFDDGCKPWQQTKEAGQVRSVENKVAHCVFDVHVQTGWKRFFLQVSRLFLLCPLSQGNNLSCFLCKNWLSWLVVFIDVIISYISIFTCEPQPLSLNFFFLLYHFDFFLQSAMTAYGTGK